MTGLPKFEVLIIDVHFRSVFRMLKLVMSGEWRQIRIKHLQEGVCEARVWVELRAGCSFESGLFSFRHSWLLLTRYYWHSFRIGLIVLIFVGIQLLVTVRGLENLFRLTVRVNLVLYIIVELVCLRQLNIIKEWSIRFHFLEFLLLILEISRRISIRRSGGLDSRRNQTEFYSFVDWGGIPLVWE